MNAQTDQGPCHIVTMGNSIQQVVGKEHIKLYKLSADSDQIMHVAHGQILAIDYPKLGTEAF